MLNIAICDDNIKFISAFEKEITSIFRSFNVNVYIDKFSDSFEFIQNYQKNFYNLVFLDICMPNINGLQVAEKLRNLDNNVELVFVTSFDKCVYRSFKFRPFRFVRKNRIKDEIEEVIEDFLKIYDSEENILSFKMKEGFININKNEILYFDIESRKIRAHTKNKIYYLTNLKFNQVVEKLNDSGFIEVHRSYLVNKKYIKEYKKNTIILANKEVIPVSRYKINEVEEIFKKRF